MAEIVLGVLGLVIQLGKCIAVPIKRQLNYLCCFNSNVQSLKEEAKKLGDEKAGLEMEVTTAENDARLIDPKVVAWLKEVNGIQQEMSELETEITNIQGGGCLSTKSRYSISKRAYKTAEAMKQERGFCHDISIISHNRPPPASVVLDILEGPTREFESRKKIEEDIMAMLRDANVKIMGICGMGGVGKTTLANKVMNKVREEKLFDESVMVVVSQKADKEKIQGEIAGNLGLKLEGISLSSRAKELCTRLVGGKRILIVLDDVWEYLKLEELGIPCKNGCSILLTSRDRGVLARMDAKPILEMEILTEKEALSFFTEKLGFRVDDQNWLSGLAQEIAIECKGLPLALANVAGALKEQKNISCWKDALLQLKSSNPEDLSEVLKDVYTPLKLSYDYLTSQNARSLFLLCCLFPEDYDIPLEDLAAYAIGLDMFDGIRELEQVRNRTYSLIEMLKSRFLLLEGRDERYARMHDVVRDVAIFIASKEKQLIKCGDSSSWISPFLEERIELSKVPTFPNLRLLLVDDSTDEELPISDIRFQGMNELSVLSIRCDDSLRSLMHITQFLKNLRTLILECPSLKTMSAVGELVNLKVLICRHCDDVEELPSEIKRLKFLKLLEISDCRDVTKIGPGVISSLDKLEELKIVNSFDKWEARNEEKENENVALTELESLSNLTCLEIKLKDSNLAALQISLSRKIEKYRIAIGDIHPGYFYPRELRKIMLLHLPVEIILGKWIHEYLANAECLILSGDGSTCLDLGKAQNIKRLCLEHCSTALSVVKSCGATIVFPLLESMSLSSLDYLEEICDIDDQISEVSSSLSNYSFKNLKKLSLWGLLSLKRLWKKSPNFVSLYSNLSSIFVRRCYRLLNLSPLSTTKDGLPQLESLRIESCDMMEQVFSWNEEENEKVIGHESRAIRVAFPKLKSLRLLDLRNLTVFYQGIENIEFPLLTDIEIRRCPKLNGLVSSFDGIQTGGDDYSLQLLCKEKVSLDNLKELPLTSKAKIMNTFSPQIPNGSFSQLEQLNINDFGNIKSLFSFSIAQNLNSLKVLSIIRCKNMVKVIEEEKETTLLFPHLEKLFLYELPKLKTFCNWRPGLELSNDCPEMKSLEKLQVQYCSMIEQVFLWSEEENGKEIIGHRHITFPNLKIVDLINLPRLTHIYKGIDSIEFPLLTEMKISCPNMKGLDINKAVDKLNGQTMYCSLSMWDQIPMDHFTRLEKLRIGNNDKISCLFSTSIAANFINLKELEVASCKNLVKVVEEDEYSNETTLLFPNLEQLDPNDLPKLKTFWNCRRGLELPKLVRALIFECPEMESFNLDSLTPPNLKSLQDFRILDCSMIEQVFLWSEEENGKEIIGQSSHNHRHITFPNLKIAYLVNLPRLTNFCKGIDSIELPLLTEMVMEGCPNIEGLVSATTSMSSYDIDNKVEGKLKEQTIYCSSPIQGRFPIDKISSLFSASVVGTLINLKELRIESCKNLVKVINGDVHEYSHETTLLFPHLEKLFLVKLPKLKVFCEWRCALKLPSLEKMGIYRCPEMERFSLGSLTTPKLNNIEIQSVCITITEDLNDVLQKRFFRLKGESNLSEGQKEKDETEEEEEESTSCEENEG